MRIVFLSHYFPPEGNAPATRVHALCKRWVEAGHDVTVVTGVPNVPDGVVYAGYRNRLRRQVEYVDGIRVVRVWTWLAANRGTVRRTLNFASFCVSAVVHRLFRRRPDVLVATSPQLFCGLAGAVLRMLRGGRFVLEIRDLWPESIVAVGALRPGRLLRVLEGLERFLYRRADHVVTVGDGYRDALVDARGVPEVEITVVTNGVDPRSYPVDTEPVYRPRWGVADRFAVGYVGTVGMAAGLDVVRRAARLLAASGRDDVVFVVVGDGADRERLERACAEDGLEGRVVFAGRLPKAEMPAALASLDACLVHLRGVELFTTVLPSKLFEAQAMAKPVVLGVRGHAERLLAASGGGAAIEPENEQELVAIATRWADDRASAQEIGAAGRAWVVDHLDWDGLASDYLRVLEQVVA